MAPSISAVSGTVATGNSLTLTCTGAGTKSRSKPYMFANWQEGTLTPHSTLSNVTSFTSTQNRSIVTDASNKRWGASNYVVKAAWPRDGTSGGRSAVLSTNVSGLGYGSKMYIAGWRKWVNGDTTGNWKTWRIYPGSGNYPNAYIGNSDISNVNNWAWFLENGTPVTGENRKFMTSPKPTSTWQFEEIRMLYNSAAGVVDGTLEVRVNNSQMTVDTTFAFDFSGIVGPIRIVNFQDTKANVDPGSTMDSYIDTFYVDDSWGRVYIGDNATFSSCTHLELQPYTNWSDGSVSVYCQLGSFASVATGRYMFLVDNSNSVSASFDLSGAAGAPAPTITSITPSSGPATGGTLVVITGTGLVATPSVTVGGGNATLESLTGSTTLNCAVPSGTVGAQDVVVTNPDAQTATLPGGFTYIAVPTLSSVSPSTSNEAGGTLVTLTGTNISSSISGVTVGGTAATSVTWVSATTVTMIVPAHAAGVVNIILTQGDGQTAQLSSAFTYSVPPVAPSITSLTPSEGATGGGTTVTVIGTDLTGSSVTLDGTAATSVTVLSNTALTFVTPSHIAGPVNVVITNQYALSATATNGFTYVGSGGGDEEEETPTGRRRRLGAARNMVRIG